MSDKQPMPVKIIAWRALERNSLRGFVSVQVGALEIRDVTVMSASGRKWCGMPGKPLIGQDGAVVKKDGKVQYSQVVVWASKEAGDRFSTSVIEALEREYPGATG